MVSVPSLVITVTLAILGGWAKIIECLNQQYQTEYTSLEQLYTSRDDLFHTYCDGQASMMNSKVVNCTLLNIIRNMPQHDMAVEHVIESISSRWIALSENSTMHWCTTTFMDWVTQPMDPIGNMVFWVGQFVTIASLVWALMRLWLSVRAYYTPVPAKRQKTSIRPGERKPVNKEMDILNMLLVAKKNTDLFDGT